MNTQKQLPLWGALTGYAIGWLWVCCFFLGFSDVNGVLPWFAPIFTAAFFLWAGFLLKDHGACSREHYFWFGCAALLSAAIGMNRCRAVDAWAWIALHGCAGYWVICRGGLLTEGKSGPLLPLDLLDAFLLSPFGGFFLRVSTVFSALRDFLRTLRGDREHTDASLKSLGISAVVILAAVPIFLVSGDLLGQADQSFAEIFRSFLDFFAFRWQLPAFLPGFALRFAFGIPVGAYLFGLVGSTYRAEHPRFDSTEFLRTMEGLRFAPAWAFSFVLIAFNCLYLLFFGVQASHLCSAFFGIIPGKLTAAQYAREGFFQLCKVMVINFGILGAAAKCSLPMRKIPKLKIPAVILMTQSIFLAVTAAGKLALYISRFGFTPLRLLSGWAILNLTAGCILALCSLKKNCDAIRKWIFFAAATFTILAFY